MTRSHHALRPPLPDAPAPERGPRLFALSYEIIHAAPYEPELNRFQTLYCDGCGKMIFTGETIYLPKAEDAIEWVLCHHCGVAVGMELLEKNGTPFTQAPPFGGGKPGYAIVPGPVDLSRPQPGPTPPPVEEPEEIPANFWD